MEVKEFEQKLGELKTGLEAVAQKAASDSVKEAIAEQMKSVNAAIEEVKKGAVPADINLKEMQEKINATVEGFDAFQLKYKNAGEAKKHLVT